ncbi:tRNA pseudouridine(13) synthase TruD [Sansalvadorimonas sp. 2012CJ34-2]|uniref:tRNA pseudouridine synthase D n=1 Tax=Parendozoicomonas callyspongiae TaxID=2942213 RepID=A0ABT0PD55_9GAMM|nr:tRNA pseudouridine(13) synthase TruD [Sansalvadorimonas sp. 2012CJ34-2]MCL6269304.1 tRNA pseudouridine(13) synthase TruD [Sansalvadorimonas sp. 2012CJ34-2]
MSCSQWSLDWPLAYGGRAGSALFKSCPEDFQVNEELPFAPIGKGEHLFLHIEKTGQNTNWLARQLAKMADIPAADVSYAGIKDRHAVTTQWFSLRIPGLPPEGEKSLWEEKLSELEGVRLLAARRHDRKLRIGALTGNHFVIRLRNFEGDHEQAEALLLQIQNHGVPNYFGDQRFGNQGHNLELARKLFQKEIKLAREKRSFALSAARSWIFNHVLADRIRTDTWRQMTDGDVLTFPQAASLILPERRDDSVAERFEEGELLVTGPLWGKGQLPSTEHVAELEQGIASEWEVFAKGLCERGLNQERRALTSLVQNMEWIWHGDDLEIKFFLYKGCYATAVIHELVTCRMLEGVQDN